MKKKGKRKQEHSDITLKIQSAFFEYADARRE